MANATFLHCWCCQINAFLTKTTLMTNHSLYVQIWSGSMWISISRKVLKSILGSSALWIHMLPHQLQRQHPPPMPPASLSTHKSAPPTNPHSPCTQLLTCGGERGEGRREMERWRSAWGRLGVRLAGRGSRVTTLTLSLSLFLCLHPPSPPPCRVSQPLLDRCVPDYTTFTTVGDWLDAIKMSRYRDNFVNAGFASFDLVAQMTAEWVKRE